MDELANTPRTTRKRVRVDNKCDNVQSDTSASTSITSLPAEIIFEILSYLSYKDLYSVRDVSTFFERHVSAPFLWRTYKVRRNELSTYEVVKELKRMPHLRSFGIYDRADCDDILRQLSLTNKSLEELHIYRCTGSTSKLYLRSGYLIRILERCRNLHTINIFGCRFRGQKFYRLLGDMGPRLRTVHTNATRSQFCTFIRHARQIGENDRDTICWAHTNMITWAPLDYSVKKRKDHVCTAEISYLHVDVNVTIDLNRSVNKLSTVE